MFFFGTTNASIGNAYMLLRMCELPNTTSGCLLTLERPGGEGGQRDPPIGFSNLKIEALKQ